MPSSIPIPPWLNISPTAPVQGMLEGYRSGLSASQAQASNAARAQQMMLAQQQAAELNAYRQQQLQQQQALLASRLAAQQENAQRRSEDYQRSIRVREQQLEKEAEAASKHMMGLQQMRKDIEGGMTEAQALVKNAENLFSERPGQFATSLRALRPPPGAMPLGPEAYTARQITDETGQPIPGMRAIPGQRSARILPGARTGLSPEAEVRRIIALMTIENKRAGGARTKEERDAAKLRVDEYVKQLENFGKAVTPAAGAPGITPLPEDFDATGRVPGKEDEETDTGEEE